MYARFKNEFGFEKYLDFTVESKFRIALAGLEYLHTIYSLKVVDTKTYIEMKEFVNFVTLNL